MESGGNTSEVISEELEQLQTMTTPYDLIALTEVDASDASDYERAVEVDSIEYRTFVSETGGNDRTMILFRDDRFNLVGSGATELSSQGDITFPGGNARQPLFVRLIDNQNDDLEFIFMVNHLARGNDRNRREQAEGLREWAREQDVGIIAAGDYNFDFDFQNLTGNRSMAIFMRRDASDRGTFVWKWLIPGTTIQATGNNFNRRVNLSADFIDTNWSDSNSDDIDDFPDSILDFIFVAQSARDWQANSTVIVREQDFPDNSQTSDHRPVEAVLDPVGS